MVKTLNKYVRRYNYIHMFDGMLLKDIFLALKGDIKFLHEIYIRILEFYKHSNVQYFFMVMYLPEKQVQCRCLYRYINMVHTYVYT